MRYATLGSGSRGNAHLIDTGQVRVLIDCGFPARELEHRLQNLGVEAKSLDALLVTHEHHDHVCGVGPMARRYGLPVWMTAGTYQGSRYGELPKLHLINCHAGGFSIGDLHITPYTVPHDSREPCQFTFRFGSKRLGLLTDVGHITPHIVDTLKACDSLILEFNHDPAMLINGPYPPSLKARVGGRHGHLSNQQALELLSNIDHARLQFLVAAHLSEKNNTPERVRGLVAEAYPGLDARLTIADQGRCSAWYELATDS